MDMIERVARALAEVIAPIVKTGPGRYSGLTQEDMLDAARAAIAEMREPTDDMLVAARHCDPDDTYGEWQAMIDEVLK